MIAGSGPRRTRLSSTSPEPKLACYASEVRDGVRIPSAVLSLELI